MFRCRHTFLDSTLLTHFRETRNSIIPPNKSLISSGMNVLQYKEEFNGVFYKILRKHMMTLLQEKSINRNQTLTKMTKFGKMRDLVGNYFRLNSFSPIISRVFVYNIKGIVETRGGITLYSCLTPKIT